MSSTKTRFGQTQTFNQEILGIEPRRKGTMETNEYNLSYTQLMEEANEFLSAARAGDYLGCIDAVIDSLYFSYGILYKLGLNEEDADKLFSIVHNANMAKKKGIKSGREGHGNAADATKPDDWVDPRFLMEQYINETNNY